jgi:hypothetical protein
VPQRPQWRKKTSARGLDNHGNIEGIFISRLP